MQSQFLELQPALITKFMKKILKDEQFILSSNVKSKFSRSLTIFLHYLFTISSQISKEKHRSTVTLEDLKKAIEETGFEEIILESLDSRVMALGLEGGPHSRKNGGTISVIKNNINENENHDGKIAIDENYEEENVVSDGGEIIEEDRIEDKGN